MSMKIYLKIPHSIKKYSLVETWLFRKRRRRLCKELGRASSCCLRRKDVHRTVFFRIQMNTQFFFHIYWYLFFPWLSSLTNFHLPATTTTITNPLSTSLLYESWKDVLLIEFKYKWNLDLTKWQGTGEMC